MHPGRRCSRARPRSTSRRIPTAAESLSRRRGRRHATGRGEPRAPPPAGLRADRAIPSRRKVSVKAPVGDSATSFPRLVSLAAHDLRTPLATIHGFAQTLVRMGELGEPQQRYIEMIDAASRQLAELLDELGLAARIESERYEPNLQTVNTLTLAEGAAEELSSDRVHVDGSGG